MSSQLQEGVVATTKAPRRVVRRRQDLDFTSAAERSINDRSADEYYEQLLLGALRSGTDVNAPEVVVEVPGYCEPTFDEKRGHIIAVEARQRLDATHRHRMEMLESLRASKEHKSLHPFQQMLVETEYWVGEREWVGSTSSRNAKSVLHRQSAAAAAGREDDESALSQQTSDAVTHITETPSYIRGKLRDYQLEGVNWLLGLQAKCINGILADEMGLGKTFQTIATLATLKYTFGLPGPHIVVCPKSVLGNWYREFRMWCPSLSVFKFHAPGALRQSLVRAHLSPPSHIRYDVVVTTFEMLVAELNSLKKIPWQYLIVDEAHKLKNEESRAHVSLASLVTNYRLIITGTPLQNNLKELWALLHFLMPHLFSEGLGANFEEWFDCAKGTENTEAITKMHSILNPLMIRRLKSDVNTGIPPKKEIYVSCQLSRRQREWYSNVLAKDAELLNRASGGCLSRLNNVIMQLRKVVNHPYLMIGGEDGPPFRTDEWIVKHSGKMVVLDLLLKKLFRDVEGRHKVLIFSQFTMMLDVLEDYMNFMDYKYCRIDGSTSSLDRELQMAQFNAPGSDLFVFLLSTRSGGLGINLQAANHVVLYDSDWNPQMDLQAQDRAHRIGQKRPVRIYRFICDGTMEEKIYKRALKKLYLDAMVVQQGRVQQRKNRSQSADELLSMIRFGAEEIFKSRTLDVSDADIDRLLDAGESKQSELTDEVKGTCQVSLASFKLGADDENLYEFEGVSYAKGSGAETKTLHMKFSEADQGTISAEQLESICSGYGEVMKCILHPNLAEGLAYFRTTFGAADAKRALEAYKGWKCMFATKDSMSIVSREMIDECLNAVGEKLGRGHRIREPVKFYTDDEVATLQQKRSKAPPLKLPKTPVYPPYQLFNAKRLQEIHNIEVALLVRNWRAKHDREDASVKDEEGQPADDAANPVAPVEELTLSVQDQEEKERLLAEGFSHWTHTEYRMVRSAISSGKIGLRDYKALTERLNGSKTEGEVRDYVTALLERGPRCIPHFESVERAIAKAIARQTWLNDLAAAVKWKLDSVPDGVEVEKGLRFKPNSKDPAMDRKMFVAAHERGVIAAAMTPQHSMDGAEAEASLHRLWDDIRRTPELRFDIFYATRSDGYFTSRLQTLVRSVRNEMTAQQQQNAAGDVGLLCAKKKRARKEDPEAAGAVPDEVGEKVEDEGVKREE